MKMHKKGLLIGKFNPPHEGHRMMIKFGLTMCEEMNVLVSGFSSDKISPKERGAAIEMSFYPSIHHKLNVRYCYSEMEEGEKDSNGTVLEEKYWQWWTNYLKTNFPGTDAVFTNDVYGERLARELGAHWYPIDPKREFLNVSATQIKINMKKYWNQILPEARRLYGTRVAIVGPESSGKTTITKEIARIMDCGYVTEHGRVMSEIRNNGLDESDFMAILNGQQVAIDTVQMLHPLVISDTEAFTTYQFARLYLKNVHGRFFIENMARMIAEKNQSFDLYILLAPNVEWVDDGLRMIVNQLDRNKWFNEMLEFLKTNNKNHVVIYSNNHYDRFQQAIKAVKNISYDRMYQSTDNVAISRHSSNW